MSELHELSALDLGSVIASGETSPVDVVDHFLRRAAEADTVGAFTTIADTHARESARRAERTLRDRRDEPLPALFGVPIGIKDLEETRGIRTTLGSRVFRDWIPDTDGEIVTILRAGGLIDIGKTTVPEFGAACYTEPDVAPPARSPFDLACGAAGSSGGAAASVGARLLPFAQGSDTAGSLRSPASVCGVIGLKPSRGLITTGPDRGDNMGLSARGPLARTVRDTAALLDVLASRPGANTVHPPAPSAGGYRAACDGPLPRLRIAVAHGSISGGPMAAESAEATTRAGLLLESLGHTVVRRDQAEDPLFTESFTLAFASLVGGLPLPPGAEPLLRPIVRHLRELATGTTAAELAVALGTLQARARAWTLDHADVDIVITPTITRPSQTLGELRDDADPAGELAAMTAFTGNTVLANATGFPALSLPVEWSARGMPIGVMFTAGWGRDDILLRLAAEVEEAAPWVERYPNI
ncbi:amidase [Embleya hyalina]|uniref:Amidase n=1 Tax=Embleya hyalina TaxID=516124 RepID=A0A401Z6Q6_9ACTN|nr:amidase [Embleya hyalina]GCE02534.1 amidase [Embleya hyalina]